MGGPGHVCLSSDSPSRTGRHQTFGPWLSLAHSDCSRVAKHAMVLGPGQHVGSNSPLISQGGEFVNPTVQSVPTQGSLQPVSACMAPRATAIQQAGFSDEVAQELRLLRDIQPELSMSQSGPFLSDGVKKIRWASGLLL